MDGIDPCSYEEADTRMFMHARDATVKVSKSLMVKAKNKDVVVTAVSVLPLLQMTGLQRLWMAFGQGPQVRWIPIHEVVLAID